MPISIRYISLFYFNFIKLLHNLCKQILLFFLKNSRIRKKRKYCNISVEKKSKECGQHINFGVVYSYFVSICYHIMVNTDFHTA